MLPKNKEDIEKADPFTKDLCGYYRTSIGAHPNTQHLVEASSFDSILGYDSFANLSMLATRPYLMIAGTKALSRFYNEDAVDASPHGELFLIDNATHADLYYKQPFVIMS